MNTEQFQQLIAEITAPIARMPVGPELETFLNERFPCGGDAFERIVRACRDGVAEGWMCAREHGGIRYGRVLQATPATHGFSVDVVEMAEVAGPHHLHPKGEIDMIMPLEGDPCFDGRPAGWCVLGPGSSHRPTVSGGRAYILYLLPEGAIEFSRA